MQEDNQLRYKNGTLQSILFAACIKQKKEVFTKNQCPLSLFTFFSFHWKQSKKTFLFLGRMGGSHYVFSRFIITIFASSYHP